MIRPQPFIIMLMSLVASLTCVAFTDPFGILGQRTTKGFGKSGALKTNRVAAPQSLTEQQRESRLPARDAFADGALQGEGSIVDPSRDYRPIRTPWRRKNLPSREEFPTWKVDRDFDQDLFTFVRVRYDAWGPFGWWDRWDNDYPDGDWNFSFRLQQLTSLNVAPNGRVLRLTDPRIFNYPFLYMAGVQRITFSLEEKKALRRYLLNGGFLMMDDFWAESGWRNVRNEMSQVLPNRRPRELTLEHAIFHCVYDLKELPQVCDLKTWSEGYRFEFWHDGFSADQAPHFWAYYDDQGRMIALCCHNNDIGDGWEREGENKEYFKEFSEKISYPLGINIITYAMTH